VLYIVAKCNNTETNKTWTDLRALEGFHICVKIRNVVELYALEMELPILQIFKKILKKHSTGDIRNILLHLRSMFSTRNVRTTICNEIVYKVSPRVENTCFSFFGRKCKSVLSVSNPIKDWRLPGRQEYRDDVKCIKFGEIWGSRCSD